MTKNLVRVLRKSREGVLVTPLTKKRNSISRLLTWEDFETSFKPTEKEFVYEMVLDEETEKQVQEVIERWNWLQQPQRFVYILRIVAKSNKNEELSVDEYSIFGSIISEYQEMFKQSPAQFIEDVKEIKKMLEGGF